MEDLTTLEQRTDRTTNTRSLDYLGRALERLIILADLDDQCDRSALCRALRAYKHALMPRQVTVLERHLHG